MPQPSQKTVTLPAAVYDEAKRVAEAIAVSTAEFVKVAIREKVARHESTTSTTHVDHQQDPPLLKSGSSVEPEPRKPVIAPAPAREAAAAPPSASVPEVEAAPGKGEERAVGDAAPASRSPRLEVGSEVKRPSTITKVSPPRDDQIRTSHPVTNPEDKKIVREVAAEISTWTCPKCHVTIPLSGRWFHKCAGDGLGSGDEPRRGEATATAAHSTVGTSSSPATAEKPVAPRRHQKESIVITRLKAFATDAARSKDPLAYMVAIVQRAYVDGGYEELPDQDAREFVTALAAKEPAIERVLDSQSTRSPSTKGGERGR